MTTSKTSYINRGNVEKLWYTNEKECRSRNQEIQQLERINLANQRHKTSMIDKEQMRNKQLCKRSKIKRWKKNNLQKIQEQRQTENKKLILLELEKNNFKNVPVLLESNKEEGWITMTYLAVRRLNY